MAFELTLKSAGSVRGAVDATRADLGVALWRAMKATGDAEFKGALRDQIKQSGLRGGPKLSKTWRGKLFPARPDPKRPTLRPAYSLVNKSPYIVESFESGAPIRARGKLLAVPIGKGRKLKLRPGMRRGQLIAVAEETYGKLVLRPTKGGQSALGALIASASGKPKFEPLFLLVREVRQPKKLDATGIARRFMAAWPDAYARAWTAEFKALDAARTAKGSAAP